MSDLSSNELVTAPENPTVADLIAFYREENFRSGVMVRVPYGATRFALETLQRNLDLRNEQIDGYERQLGIIDKGAEHTIGSEIARLLEIERASAEPRTTPVAWVPVHPKNGPLWASTIASKEADHPEHYPLMPLYTSEPPSDAVFERGCYALMQMMQAYERRIRSECTTQEQINKRPWECSEYIAAAEYLKKVWPPYSRARAELTKSDAAHVDELARAGCTCPVRETYDGKHREGCPAEWLPLKKYGYAPGNYTMKCPHCKVSVWDVDKRAMCCKPCAIAFYESEQRASTETGDAP